MSRYRNQSGGIRKAESFRTAALEIVKNKQQRYRRNFSEGTLGQSGLQEKVIRTPAPADPRRRVSSLDMSSIAVSNIFTLRIFDTRPWKRRVLDNTTRRDIACYSLMTPSLPAWGRGKTRSVSLLIRRAQPLAKGRGHPPNRLARGQTHPAPFGHPSARSPRSTSGRHIALCGSEVR